MTLRLVLRSLLRQPAVAAAVVATIGLAVAANTALFSIVDGLLFRPLPYKQAERIVHLALEPSTRATRSKTDLQMLAERAAVTPSLVDRADARPAFLFDPTGPATEEWGIRTAFLSPSAFDLLGVRVMLGRAFVDQDRHDPPFAVLLGHSLWKTRFGADASIVDRLIDVPGAPPERRWRVVGVMPEGFSFPGGSNFWVPTYPSYASPPVMPFARLAPGVTVDSVRAELPGIVFTPLREHVQPRGAFSLSILLMAAALLLLLALVQVAGLLLARATGRLTEIGMRLALGASRGQLAREFALEGATLVFLGLGLAVLATPALTSLIVRALPPELTIGQHVAPDGRAFAYAGFCSAVGLLVLTVVPIDIVRRTSPLGLLQGRALGNVRLQTGRVRNGLFVAQLSIVTVLVYLTFLTFHSFVNLTSVDLGFDPSNLVAISLPRSDSLAPATRTARIARQRELVSETLNSLRDLPGVRQVAGSHLWPMQPGGLRPEALPSSSDPDRFPTPGKLGVIAPGFIGVLGIQLLDGAEPTQAELADVGARGPAGEQVALANATLARQIQRHGQPVGQLIAGRFRIVGVIPDITLENPDRPTEPTVLVYVPPPMPPAVVLVRVEPGRAVEDTGISGVLSRIWGSAAARPLLVQEAIRLATHEYRARTFLLGLVSALTIPLAMIGVAATLTFGVRQRTRDLAIRLALGADPHSIERYVVLQALAAAAIALAGGLLAGAALGMLMRATLFGVASIDPTAVAGAIAFMLAVVWLAALIPARRASRIDPIHALRES